MNEMLGNGGLAIDRRLMICRLFSSPIVSPTPSSSKDPLIEEIDVIQDSLRDAISEDHEMYWHLANRLRDRFPGRPEADERKTALHHLGVIVWIQQFLFSKRTQPLCAKGVFRQLNDAQRRVAMELKLPPATDADTMMVRAQLGILQLVTGEENREIVSLAEQLDQVFESEDDLPGTVGKIPVSFAPSLAVIVADLEKDLKHVDTKVPIDRPVGEPELPIEDVELELPQL